MTTPTPQNLKQNLEAKKDNRWVERAVLNSENKSNVLENLKSNLDRLEELHHRLKFMLGEIKGLIRR